VRARQELFAAQAELRTARGDAENLRTELNVMKARVDELDAGLSAEKKRAAALDAELGIAGSRAKELEAELGIVTVRVKELETELGVARARIREVETSRTDSAAAAAAGDDLKVLKGIGPKFEKLLRGAGVTSIAQIASWTESDIDTFAKELGIKPERIRKDDWVGSAKRALPGG
jgi:NADH-quinone oxidoreductase subunit E